MKILQALDFFSTEFGTPELYLCKAMKRSGDKIVILSSFLSHKKYVKKNSKETEIEPDIKVIKVPHLFYVGDWMFFSNKYIKEISKINPEIINIHELRLPLSYLVAKNKKRLCKPVVLTQHAYKPVQNKFFRVLYYIWMYTFGKTVIKNVDKFIALSNAQKDYLIKWDIPKDKIEIIPSGVDTNIFLPSKDKNNEVVFLGTYDKNKLNYYLPIIPELAKKYPKWNFVFYGAGSWDKQINLITKKFKNVYNRGFVPKEKVPEILKKGKIFVLPSINEVFGLSACEASSCGLPCIVNKTGGLQEIVEDGKTGFIFDNNSEELKKKIELLIENERLRNSMSKKARERMIKYFDWKDIAKKTEKAYDEVVKDFKRKSPLK